MEPLNCSAKGAINEHRVMLDLMERGYEVYRAINGGAPLDLVAIRGDEIVRVEVTVGVRYEPTGWICVPNSKKDRTRFDVLAIVVNGQINYDPQEAIS